MVSKADSNASGTGFPLDWRAGRSDAFADLQSELLEVYEQTSRGWLARVQAEVDLWSRLATKLPAARSVPEAMQAYQECISQRMQMAAEDGRRLSEDCQKIVQTITTSLTNNSSKGST